MIATGRAVMASNCASTRRKASHLIGYQVGFVRNFPDAERSHQRHEGMVPAAKAKSVDQIAMNRRRVEIRDDPLHGFPRLMSSIPRLPGSRQHRLKEPPPQIRRQFCQLRRLER